MGENQRDDEECRRDSAGISGNQRGNAERLVSDRVQLQSDKLSKVESSEASLAGKMSACLVCLGEIEEGIGNSNRSLRHEH